MTFRLEDPHHEYFAQVGFFICHDKDTQTLAFLGMHPMLRWLALDGVSNVLAFEWRVECFDERGNALGSKLYRTECSQEMVFESGQFFSEPVLAAGQRIIGYARLSVEALILSSPPVRALPKSARNFNGVLTIYRPGSFITGVHMYHGVSFYPWFVVVKHYLKSLVRRAFHWTVPRERGAVWKGDAVAAVAAHSTASSGGIGIVIMHSENWYPGFCSQMEFRSEAGQVSRYSIPYIRPGGTYKAVLPLRDENAGGVWAQPLCIDPPLGMSRFLAGEEFTDGSLTLDHAYFQQPSGSSWGKEQEPKFFRRTMLDEKILGPTNPWFCTHGEGEESLIAISNQFHPENEYRFDLLVFAEDGQLVLRKREFCILPPWGFAVPSISESLLEAGIKKFRGIYMLAYSATNKQELLPSRLHVQGIYRFRGGFWTGVQGDGFIWSSPANPTAEMEALTAKVRRRQLWYCPVIDNENIETLISVANLSYSLDYDSEQTLYLRYCRGHDVVAEKEITLPPFGSALVSVRELFGGQMNQRNERGSEYGEVLIYPKTGKTYCVSYMMRETQTGRFFPEHVLSVPKFEHEH